MILTHLRAVRESKFLTQGDLARLTGMSRATINRLEQGGGARFSTVRKIAVALGVNHSALIAGYWAANPSMMTKDEAVKEVVERLSDACRDERPGRIIMPLADIVDVRAYGDALADAIRSVPGVSSVQFYLSLDDWSPGFADQMPDWTFGDTPVMSGYVIECGQPEASRA